MLRTSRLVPPRLGHYRAPSLQQDSPRTKHSNDRGCKSENFLTYIKEFHDYGSPTHITQEGDIPYYTNEYWTAGQRRADALHEISYRACFKPQLPDFFIAQLTGPGGRVYDPFMGRGTTILQAALRGRQAFGCDCNPLSQLLVRPRLHPPSLEAIRLRLQTIDWSQKIEDLADMECREDLLAFYHPDSLRQIMILRAWLMREAPRDDSAPDSVVDWIHMVALNRLTGHSSGFFSIYSLPPNLAASPTAQRKINQRHNQTPPPRDIVTLIMKKSRSLLRHHESPSLGYGAANKGQPNSPASTGDIPHSLWVGDAANSPQIPDASVDLVVTSPPFLDIVDYARDNWLRCWFAGIDTDTVALSIHRKPEDWTAMVRRVLTELARVVRGGGHVAFEVGEVRRGTILLEKLVWQAAQDLPFERLAVIVNQQNFTKTANCWGVTNNQGGVNSNRIVLLKRI